MRIVLCLVVLAGGLSAQSQQGAATAQQLAAIEKQRRAARQQLADRVTSGHAFFTTGWTAPPARSATAAAAPAKGFDCEPLTKEQADTLIETNAAQNGLTPDVLRALIRKESAFHPCAVSHKGAMGLMQLMPGTAQDLRVLDPFDPADNVRAGSQYLRQLLDRYDGDLILALSAYNAGPGRVDAVRGIPAIKETQDYVRDIMNRVGEAPQN